MPLALILILSACGGAPVGSPPEPGSPSPGPIASVPAGLVPPVIDQTGDPLAALVRQGVDDRSRLRGQAGFANEIGSGWNALSTAADAATNAAAQALAAKLAISVPTTSRGASLASVAIPHRGDPNPSASVASSMALISSVLLAGQALGLGSTLELTVSESRDTIASGSVATVTINGHGAATSTGSKVVADFSFDMTGTVSSTATGATGHMTGSAGVHIEIDGCPNADGSSKGKVTLSSSENLTTGVGWSREITADFDISVDDDASISGLTIDAQALEQVRPSTEPSEGQEGPTHGHELGIGTHVEYTAGPGFSGMTHNADALTLDITDEEDSTSADLIALFGSALGATVVAAHTLGKAAETFWRGGKCIEVIVDPAGGDVDPDSTTDVVVKVKQRFEGNELTKPVEATLTGVASIDPAGTKQPAPATFKYTAGSNPGAKGNLQLESVSNRGIGSKDVTFTVRTRHWTVNADTPSGQIRGVKCEGIGGQWTMRVEEHVDTIVLTTVWNVTIVETTLAGSYTYETTSEFTAAGASTRQNATGKARILINQDGTVMMTLDPAPVTITTTFVDDDSTTITIPGLGNTFLWRVDPAAECE